MIIDLNTIKIDRTIIRYPYLHKFLLKFSLFIMHYRRDWVGELLI